jgi:hypothetical protein
MSFKSKVAEINKKQTAIHSPKSPSHLSPHFSPKSPSNSPKIKKKEPRYIFLGFFTHGGFSKAAEPYRHNKYASVSIKTRHSIPKLMTFMNCSPGSSLIGEVGGIDNVVLADYFYKSSDFDITDISNFEPKGKTEDKLISQNFLGYMNSAVDTLSLRPRHRTEHFKIANQKDVDVCRNSFICDDKIGISHRFTNKSFSTNDVPKHTTPGENWGIFIYNNNCGIEPGMDIQLINEISRDAIEDKEGQIVGFDFHLADIISGLTKKYELTEDDYLFLFDYSCNNFSTKSINQQDDARLTRRLGRSVTSDFGFGKKKRGTRKSSKLKKRNKNKIKI